VDWVQIHPHGQVILRLQSSIDMLKVLSMGRGRVFVSTA
jgi:hypothetical protein